MANTVQHILAKEKGIAVSGYVDAVFQAYRNGLISQELFQRLKPFFDFRNTLIHRYRTIDDERLISDIQSGLADFDRFIEEVETFISTQP